ncbi:hypothetical protein [Methanobacterium subterraneum]|nr:hypothetical protein [Methanobacterium subterraneum]
MLICSPTSADAVLKETAMFAPAKAHPDVDAINIKLIKMANVNLPIFI